MGPGIHNPIPPLPVNRYASENITLPQLRWRAVNMTLLDLYTVHRVASVLFYCSAVFLVTYITLVCCPGVRRSYPANFICLAIFVSIQS